MTAPFNGASLDELVFWRPACYRPNGVAGSGAYAVVVRAEIVDPTFAAQLYKLGLLLPADDESTGDGADGVRDAATGCVSVAIKQIIDHWTFAESRNADFALHYLRKVCRELSVLLHFRQVPQIINLVDVYTAPERQDVYIVMPYVQYTLKQVLEKFHPLEEGLVKWIVFQVLFGLRALHRGGIIHRDLTLTNILVGADRRTWPAWISDFGLSRARESADENLTLDVVTMPYRAPEVLMGFSAYTTAIDVWALGCVMAECFLGRPFLYLGDNVNPDSFKQLKLIIQGLTGFPDVDRTAQFASASNGEFLRKWRDDATAAGKVLPSAKGVAARMASVRPDVAVSQEALDVLQRMLLLMPGDRATVDELLQMPWFASDPSIPLQDTLLEAEETTPSTPWDNSVEAMDFEQLQELLAAITRGRVADTRSVMRPLDGDVFQLDSEQ